MGYHTGTITDANPSNAFSDLLKTWVGEAGCANWSFIENIPAGTGAGQSGSASYSCDVYKCAGTGDDANDAGVDWYVGVIRYGTTATLGWFIAESYNAVDKKFAKYIHNYAGRTHYLSCNEDGYAYYTTQYTYNDATAAIVYGSWGFVSATSINTTGFTYWVLLDKNFILISTKVSTTEKSAVAGLMDSAVDASIGDALPLVHMGSNMTGSFSLGGFTKLPGIGPFTGTSGVTNSAFGVDILPWTAGPGPGCLVSNATGAVDRWQLGKVFVSRIACIHKVSYSIPATLYNIGFFRGLLKEELLCIRAGGTVAIGDTVTIGGTTYTVLTNSINTLHFIAAVS